MKFIPENTIDDTVELFQNESYYNTCLEDITTHQKDLMAFIDEENQSLLTKEELGIIQYLTMVICKSVQQYHELKPISGNLLEEAEESNWAVFHDAQFKRFKQVMDKFFDGYPQEDLLALVEDTVQEEEDDSITQVGREIIIVVAKSIIDVLHQILK
jgi:hypothetical protein